MSESVLNAKVGADTSAFHAAMDKMIDSVAKFGLVMEGLEHAFKFDAIKESFSEFIHASSEARESQNKFIGAMRASGEAADPEKFFRLAESLEKTTIFSKDATIEAASMFGRFKIGQKDIEKLIPAVQDLSAFMGTDMVSTADAMGKAIGNGSEGLRALKLGFNASEKAAFDAADANQRQVMILAKVKSFADGTAQSMAQTAAGAGKQLTNAMENLHETFGQLIDRPVAAFFHAITNAVDGLSTWFEKLSPTMRDVVALSAGAVAGFAALAAGLVTAATTVGAVATAWNAVAAAFALAGAAAEGEAAAAGAATAASTGILLPVLAIVAAAAGLAVVAAAVKVAWDKNLGGMKDTVIGFVDTVKKKFTEITASVADMVRKVKQYFTELFDSVGKRWKSWAKDLSDPLLKVYGRMSGMTPKQTKRLQDENAASDAGLLSNMQNNLADAAAPLKQAFTDGAKDITEAGKSFGAFAGDTVAELGNMFGGMGDSAVALIKNIMDKAGLSGIGGKGGIGGGPAVTGEEGSGSAAFYTALSKTTGVTAASMEVIKASMEKAAAAARAAGVTADSIPASAAKFAADMGSMGSAVATGQAQQSEYFKTMAGQMDKAKAEVAPTLMGAVASTGPAGQVMGKLASGDAAGAAMTAIGATLANSEAFKRIMERLNGLFVMLGKVIDPLFQALEPLIVLFTSLFKTVVSLVTLGPLFKNAMSAIQALTELIVKAFNALIQAWNSMIDGLANFLGKIPGIGDDLKAWTNDLKIDEIGLGDSSGNAAASLGVLNKEVKGLTDTTQNLPPGFKVALAQYNASNGQLPSGASLPMPDISGMSGISLDPGRALGQPPGHFGTAVAAAPTSTTNVGTVNVTATPRTLADIIAEINKKTVYNNSGQTQLPSTSRLRGF